MRLAVEEQHAWREHRRLHRWAGGAFQLVVSAEILFELQEVLTPGLNSAATFPPDLGWPLVSQGQNDRHDRDSHTTEEIGADGYKAGDGSP